MYGWLPAIISFVSLIVTYSSLPFLFPPIPFVCPTFLLSIWPTIDKAQSLTMLGVLLRILGDGALCIVVCACSGFRKKMGFGSHYCLSTFNFQMVKECVSWHTFVLSHSLSFPLHFQHHPSCGPLQCMDCFCPEYEVKGRCLDGQEGRMRLERESWKSCGSLRETLYVFSDIVWQLMS